MRPPLDGKLVVTQLFGGNPNAEAYTTANGIRVLGHTGIDFSAELGQDVYPAWPGRVTVVDSGDSGFGLHVWITTNDGRTALYGHLSEVHVRSGDNVVPHVPFAKAGSTGFSTGPHVHFEIHEANSDPHNGWNGARDPLGGFDQDVLDRFDFSATNL